LFTQSLVEIEYTYPRTLLCDRSHRQKYMMTWFALHNIVVCICCRCLHII